MMIPSLYQDVGVGIIPERGLNNGQPHFLAFLIHLGKLQDGEHAVHIGTGVGYYTAIIAELAGNKGTVTAVEFVPELAARAKNNLGAYPNVRVTHGDGFMMMLEPADVIYVNAGASKPSEVWLDALQDGGRLILPLTVTFTSDQGHAMTRGAIFRIERRGVDYTAQWMGGTDLSLCRRSRRGIRGCAGGGLQERRLGQRHPPLSYRRHSRRAVLGPRDRLVTGVQLIRCTGPPITPQALTVPAISGRGSERSLGPS